MKLTPTLMICGLALSLMACGRGTKIYQDGNNVAFAPPPVWTEAKSPLPADFLDHSVNQASVLVALGGVTGQPLAFRLQTAGSTTSSGGYNGTGTGNRAMLGMSGYSGYQLASSSGFTFDAKSLVGTERVSLLLIIDLNCYALTPDRRVIMAESGDLSAPPTPTTVGDGYKRYSAKFIENRWKSAGAAITNPAGAEVLPASTGTATSLTSLLLNFPQACFRNAASGDPGLPNSLPTSAIIFALGTPNTDTFNSTFINRITIGSDELEDMEWQ